MQELSLRLKHNPLPLGDFNNPVIQIKKLELIFYG